jgi:L-methionine (R)-S-oxide reductase
VAPVSSPGPIPVASPLDLTEAPPGEPLTDAQRGIVAAIRGRLADGAPFASALDFMVGELKRLFPHHAWSGVYLREGPMLVLGPFRGPDSPHHRIRVGEEGICGWVAKHGKAQVIPDVGADPRYLMCSAAIRSEIVVPIARAGDVLGVIDIDSEIPAAFTRGEFEVLTELAAALASAAPASPAGEAR